jgi:hypothetical protein
MCNLVGGFRIMLSSGWQLRHEELNIIEKKMPQIIKVL